MTYKLALSSVLAFSAVTVPAVAQTMQEAFKFSSGISTGSARAQALGGAVGALGGEMSAVYVNPAAAGFSRRDDVSFTIAYHYIQNTNYYLGNKDNTSKGSLKVDNFTMLILNSEKERPTIFTMGVNRVNNFKEHISYQGNMVNSSQSLNYFMLADEAHVRNPEALLSENADVKLRHTAALAYQTYLINPYREGDQYKFFSAAAAADHSVLVNQSRHIITTGGTSEVTLALSKQRNNKFSIGGSINIDILTQRQQLVWTETNVNPIHADLNTFEVTETSTTNGLGVNFKIGGIYKPVLPVNLGLSLQSPTWFGMHKDYQTDMATNTKSAGIVKASTIHQANNDNRSDPDVFNYSLKTPWKATASAVVLFNTAGNTALPYGFISVDYEMKDYSFIKLQYGDGLDTPASNDATGSSWRMTGNLRAGGEIRYLFYSLRLGYAHSSSPYKDTRPDGSATYYSGGIGYKAKSGYYADLSVVAGGNQQRKEVPFEMLANNYGYESPPAAQITNAATRVAITFGLRF